MNFILRFFFKNCASVFSISNLFSFLFSVSLCKEQLLGNETVRISFSNFRGVPSDKKVATDILTLLKLSITLR